jgi:hypothetical protein
VPLPDRERSGGVAVAARATAELAPEVAGLGMADDASGAGYDGPLAPGQAHALFVCRAVEPHWGLRLQPRGSLCQPGEPDARDCSLRRK